MGTNLLLTSVHQQRRLAEPVAVRRTNVLIAAFCLGVVVLGQA